MLLLELRLAKAVGARLGDRLVVVTDAGHADAALTAGAFTPPLATEGAAVSNAVVFHFSDADPNGTASDYVATVNTGDAEPGELTAPEQPL